MNPTRKILASLVYLATALFLAACSTHSTTSGSQSYIFLENDETLFVQFSAQLQIPPLELSLENSDVFGDLSNRDLQLHQEFTVIAESLLSRLNLPVEVRILKDGEEPGRGPLLDLSAVQLKSNGIRLKAELEKYGVSNHIGLYSHFVTPYPNQSKTDRALLQNLLIRTLIDLNEHFPTPYEQELLNPTPYEESIGSKEAPNNSTL